MQEQVDRAYEQYNSRPTDIAKNTFMTSLKEQDEVLYYKVCWLNRYALRDANFKRLNKQLIEDHLKEMFPVIYTPTEGEAIANYSRLFRRPEGCFLNINDQDCIEDNLDQWGPPDDIDLVVVSDGEQVGEW